MFEKEFHELFAQTNGRIFALLISTDGRGHFDNRGRLALDYCAAGQTFDLPKGMFDSDKYRDTDVVLTFAKLEHDGDYLLVDAHSAKEPAIKPKDTQNNKDTEERSGSITFAGSAIPLQKFYTDYQNKSVIVIPNAIPSYPCILSASDLYYMQYSINVGEYTDYNNSKLRKKACEQWCTHNDKTTYKIDDLNEIKDHYYVDTKEEIYKSIKELIAPFENIVDIVDVNKLDSFKSNWRHNKKVFEHAPSNEEVAKVREVKDTDTKNINGVRSLDNASAALNYYIDFLKSEYKPAYHNPRNLIYFGAPGTGKSYKLNKDLEQFEGRYERVTFYSDYLHAQFVGSYRPKATVKSGGEADFTYAFTPGPFTRVLIDALNDPDPEREHVLVIEEINRADPASVFGDIFQLLDRNADGNSTYPITVSEDMKAYLWSGLNKEYGRKRLSEITGQHYDTTSDSAPKSFSIAIPSSMLIWATMNSADQGVYPMDTAFKRRWNFRYVAINDGESAINDTWNTHRKEINTRLLTKAKVSEDKLLGPFFLGSPNLAPDSDEFNEAFKNKVIMYLFEDAARYKRTEIFNEKTVEEKVKNVNGGSYTGLTLSALFTAWDADTFDIFKKPNE